jgi:ABC-type nitrate/sulfonate/bicarbonate transport system ATPase subunit
MALAENRYMDARTDRPRPAPKPADLHLAGVSKFFPTRDGGRLQALKDIDLTVEAGTIHALLGRSGCGKSTLLNIIAGLMEPDAGTVRVDGAALDCSRPTPFIGYMFQDDRLMPWRTASANVAFALENQPLGKAERAAKVTEMLELVGLTGFGNAFPNELSGGMRSRVALARSLVRQPRLLLMDEPFSRLDSETRDAMHEEIVRLRNLLGMTVLFVTHDVEEAVVLADAITVLAPRPGRVAEAVDLGREMPSAGRLRDSTDPQVVEQIRRLKATLMRVSARERTVS